MELLTFELVTNTLFYGLCGYSTLGLLIWLLSGYMKEVLFLNRLKFPTGNLKNPSKLFKGANNYYVKSESGNTLGVWHIPAADGSELHDANKVVLYVHGNAFTRGSKNRICYYHLLQDNGFHVITFDYSGFADSTGKPEQRTVISDTISIYMWMKQEITNPNALIIVHGHSLGTSICTQAIAQMQAMYKSVSGPDVLILEAPFTCCKDAIFHYPVSKITLTLYPFFKNVFIRMIEKLNITMDTKKYLPEIKAHVLVLHAEDDDKVHYELGYTLYQTLTDNIASRAPSVTFYGFAKKHSLKHFPTQHKQFCTILNDYLHALRYQNYSKCKEVYY